MDDKDKLLLRLQIAEFSAFETALFLDTHNTDPDALAYFAKCRKKAKELEQEYVSKYGPLRIGQDESEKVGSWSKGPWPWEYSAN